MNEGTPRPDTLQPPDIRRAQFFPVMSLEGKRNYKRLHRIERDGSITERVFLNVLEPSKRETLICRHYLRHLVRHFVHEDTRLNILGRDDPWDFRLALSTGRVFNLEITSIADSPQHFMLNKREERLEKLSRQAAIPLHELEKLDSLFPSPEIAAALRQYYEANRASEELVPNPFSEVKERIVLGTLFQPEVSLADQVSSVIRKKLEKNHNGKEETVLIIDNRTSAFDSPDYQDAAASLQPFVEATPFPEIWFYTGYCSDDDGNNAEFSFAPLKVTAEQGLVLERLSLAAQNGRVVW